MTPSLFGFARRDVLAPPIANVEGPCSSRDIIGYEQGESSGSTSCLSEGFALVTTSVLDVDRIQASGIAYVVSF